VVNRHSFILIRQMVSLVRRALAEVCTVPVLLVVCEFGIFCYISDHFGTEIWNLELTFKSGNFLYCVAFYAVFRAIFCTFESTSGFPILLSIPKSVNNNET